MREAGFEPAHPEIVGLKSTALDHSAIRAQHIFYFIFSEEATPHPFLTLFVSLNPFFKLPTFHVRRCDTTGEFAKRGSPILGLLMCLLPCCSLRNIARGWLRHGLTNHR